MRSVSTFAVRSSVSGWYSRSQPLTRALHVLFEQHSKVRRPSFVRIDVDHQILSGVTMGTMISFQGALHAHHRSSAPFYGAEAERKL